MTAIRETIDIEIESSRGEGKWGNAGWSALLGQTATAI